VRTTATSPKMLLQSTLVVADEDELVTTLPSGALPSTVNARCLAAAEDGPTIAVATGLSFPAMKGAGESDSPSSLWGQLTALLGPREAVANRNWTTVSDDDRRLGRSLLEQSVRGSLPLAAAQVAALREALVVDGWAECCAHDSRLPGPLVVAETGGNVTANPCFSGGLYWVFYAGEAAVLCNYYAIPEDE